MEIDLSYNALTDRVIDILKQYAISNHFEYLLDHNSFTQTPQFSQPQQQPQNSPQFQILLGPSNPIDLLDKWKNMKNIFPRCPQIMSD